MRARRLETSLLATALVTIPLLGDASPSSRSGAPDPFDTVVLDAGHGGDDEGAIGPKGLREKDVALDVARRLAAKLRDHGLGVVMTRDADVFVPLEARTALANDARADLFVSVHANASPDPRVRGLETFFLSLGEATDDEARAVALRENEAFGGASAAVPKESDPLLAILGDMISNEYLSRSDEFAKIACARLAGGDCQDSRGVKQAPFVVLANVQMPAALVEIGFITNADDEAVLRSKTGRDGIAEALYRAIVDYGRRHDARRGTASAVPAAGEEGP